ncbi:MAG: hypothetical protein CMK74_17995 [Pseudomonadales bacterium]|nr:hypothetical protein [Pseudomonadales bacterium]
MSRMPEEEVLALKRRVGVLERELASAVSNNRRRNLELDALHYVWCSGGCTGGVHRFDGEGPRAVTLEVVEAAERNTARLRQWYESHRAKRTEDEQ